MDLPALTVHRILARLDRLAFLDRPVGQVIRRCERGRSGDLVPVGIKGLGRIPDGGGRRVHGRAACPPPPPQASTTQDSAADDHSRLAHRGVRPDEKAATRAGFSRRAAGFLASAGIRHIERVLTDNARPYRQSPAWKQALADLGATARPTRIRRPQTTAKPDASTTPCSTKGHIHALHRSQECTTAPGRLPPYLQSPALPHRTR